MVANLPNLPNLPNVATMANIAGAGRGGIVTVVTGGGGAHLEPADLDLALDSGRPARRRVPQSGRSPMPPVITRILYKDLMHARPRHPTRAYTTMTRVEFSAPSGASLPPRYPATPSILSQLGQSRSRRHF